MPRIKSQPLLVLPTVLREQLEYWAERAYPQEGCGLLIGRSAMPLTEVLYAEDVPNREVERLDRFDLDPLDLMKADARARAEGLDIVGIWHSHPDHPARPSTVDLERAWAGWSYVIASVRKARVAEVRSWRLMDGIFLEEEIWQTDA